MNFLRLRPVQTFVWTLFFIVSAQAFAAPKSAESLSGLIIKAVDVRGLKRIDKEAVISKINSKVGQSIDSETIRSDVQTLFKMGYFDEIEVQGEAEAGQAKLIILLKERPAIAKIEFVGNERIDTSDLEGVIKIKKWSILDINKVKDDVAFISKHYEEKGFYLAKVSYEIKNTKSGEVELRYKIDDFDKVQIKKITFLNNKAFGDEQLKNILAETKEGGFFSFFSGSGSFKESAFKVDLQRLTLWYLDNGFVKFKHDTPIVTVSDDKKWLFITIRVEEGDPYKIGEIDFSGDLLFSRGELHQDILHSKDQVFSYTKRNADIQKLTERYQDLGYAFANVIPKMDIKDDTKTVNIDYAFEKGSLAYFGEINIVGNAKTHDKVIRRELKIHEGELFNGTRLRQSKENVERLGFFQPGEVIFNQSTPKGKNDIVDIEIQLKERPTGTVTLGAGYGSVQGLFFTTTVSETNFLGKGQNLSLATNITKDSRNKSVSLGFTDPYAFDTRWSAGFDGYYTTFFIPSRYLTRRLGFNVRLGYPIFEFTNAFITYKREKMRIQDIEIINRDAQDDAEIRADEGALQSVILSMVRDKRNNRFETTSGNFQSASVESAGFNGDKRFLKWVLNNRIYFKVVGDLVFRNSTEYGQATGRDGRVVPPSERFYLGGPNNLRGYEFFSVGPQRAKVNQFGETVNIPLGGTYQMMSLFELEHPLIRDAGLKFVTFFDIGNVFTDLPTFRELQLKKNWGFGIRWFSPIGPLRFEWGFPINPKAGENGSVFQFFIGPPF